MNPKNRVTLTIESIPPELRTLIVSKVGNTSPIDYFNTIITSKSLSFSYKNNTIAKTLNLSSFVKKPALASGYKTLLESCLKADNMDAHFINGMLEFFQSQDQILGLHHLKVAADGGHLQGRYVYGVLLLAIGQTENGVTIINNLTDEQDIGVVEDCMANFKRSLEQPFQHMKDTYVSSFMKMLPEQDCHPQDGTENTVCFKCFHFYLLTEFYTVMMGFNDLLH